MTKVGSLDDSLWTELTPAESDERARLRKGWVPIIVLLALLAVVVAYPAAAALLSRRDYGTFAFWKVPERIDYCGRRYYDSGPHFIGNLASVQAQDADSSARWTFLSWTFSGRSIYADVSPLRPPWNGVCTMELYIPLDDGTWETYALSGGP